MKRILLLLIFCGCIQIQVSYGQQYLYSQYFANPLAINPALTGHFGGSFRFSSISRSQWAEDGNPYKSLAASVEKSLLESSSSGKLGIGLLVSSDNSNQDAFSVKKAAFSAAYNMELDDEGNVELGAGFQGQYNQRRINPYNLTFESQFGSGGFNTGIATPEMGKATTMSYTSLNAGILLNIKSLEARQLFYFGLAAYNTNQAKTNLLDAAFIEPVRWNIQSGGTIPLNPRTNLHLSSIVTLQQGASEILAGTVGSFDLGENGGGKKLLVGSWIRLKDALIPYIGLQWNGVQAALSYDINTSSIKTGAYNRNSMEFSLGYQPWGSLLKKDVIPCPFF